MFWVFYITNASFQRRKQIYSIHTHRRHKYPWAYRKIVSSAISVVVLYIATLNIYNLIGSFLEKDTEGSIFYFWREIRKGPFFFSFFFFADAHLCESLYTRLPVAVAMAESGMNSGTVTTSVSRDLTGRTGNHHRTSVRSRNSRTSGMRSG